MKSPTLRFSIKRLFLLTLVSFVAVAALLGIAASANKANRAAKAREVREAQATASKAAIIKNSVAQQQQPLAPNAASIMATLTDNVAPATKVAPGGIINYTAVITNAPGTSPTDDAGSVVYNGNLDPNTTISGLVQVSPVTINDTYPVTVIGNVSINSHFLPVPYSVFTNDYQGQNGGALALATSGTTANGGQIVLNTTPGPDFGEFTYNPPPGFEGNDTFTYTLANSVGSSIGTVTIPVSGMVWFINNNAAACTTLAGGCGRLSNPFSTLAAFQALNNGAGNNPAINDNIFVFESATTYTGGVTLLGGQKFIGQDATDTLATITGLTPQSGSAAFPVMNTGAPATTITNAGGVGITLNSTATSNTIRGLTVTNTSAAKISGNSFGTLTVGKSGSPDVTLSGTGQAMNLTTGTFAATSAFTSVAATSSTTTGMSITSVGGTVAFGSTTTSSTTNQGIFVTTSAVNINFGNTAVTTSGGIGINLVTNSGTATFAGLDITPNAGQRSFHATSNSGTITTTSGTITATTGTAVEIVGTSSASRTPLNMTLTSVSNSGAANGIVLTNVNGPGASVGFIVVGDGTNTTRGGNNTGGTIANTSGGDGATTGIGIRLENADEVTLRRMHLNDHPNYAIRAFTSSNFTMEYSNINGLNGTNESFDEGSIYFTDTTGTNLFKSSLLHGGKEDTIRITNSGSTVLTGMTFDDCAISQTDVPVGGDAIKFETLGTSTMTLVTVKNSSVTAAKGDLIDGNTVFGSTMSLAIKNNAFSNNHTGIVAAGGGSKVSSNGVMKIDVDGNTFRDAVGTLLIVNASGTASPGPDQGVIEGYIRNNVFGVAGVANSGSTSASTLQIESNGGGDDTLVVSNNQAFQYNNHGIFLSFVDDQGKTANINMTIDGNTVNTPGNINTNFNAFHLNNGATSGPPAPGDDFNSCIDVKNNNFTGGGQGATPPNNGDVRLRQRIITTVRLPGYTGASNDNAAVITYLRTAGGGGIKNNSFNVGNAANTVSTGGGGYINTAGSAPCTQPSFASLRPVEAGSASADSASAQDAGVGAISPMHSVIAIPTATTISSMMANVSPIVMNNQQPRVNEPRRSHHAQFNRSQAAKASASDQQPLAPDSGEPVGPINIGTLPAGKSVTIKYAATVNVPPLVRQVSHQGTVTFINGAGSPLLTDDTDLPGGAADPTGTLIDTLMTWNGATSTDWNVATNWTQPAGGTQYAPGVSNPAVNDVVIPNVGAQPNISATNIDIFSLNLSNGRTLTINGGRTLTIDGAAATSDLTLDGIISGGALNFAGAGPHVINNAGGTGSLSSTNVMTLLSPASVTLNQNLQAGAVAVNSGATLNITNRTLSLNGAGATFAVAGGATFTVPGSTVVFDGTAAQQAAGTSYANLTINNSIGLNVTGVTLTGNALVGTLVLTSSDLDTGAFTLTQSSVGISSGISDVVGTVKRSSGGIGLPPGVALTFGNPNNRITFTGGAPNDATVVLTKAAPATYAAAVQRNYVISHVGGAGFTSATVRLRYLDPEVTGLNSEATLNLRRLRTSDSHWVAQLPTTRDTTNNWVESNPVAAADLATQWTFSSLAPTASDGIVIGRIVDDQGNPVEGAVVRLQGTQNRKFITDANGFYRFENVATNGFYTVTPSRVNYQFSPTVQSFSQIGETTNAAFGAVRTDGTENPLDTPEYFVRQHYIDFLGREPDEAGFNFWSDQILECGAANNIDQNCIERRRENVSAAYFLSIEFQQTGGLVDGLNRASYGTAPQFGSFMPDTRAIGLGVVVGREGWEAKLAANKEAFINAFVNRAAFHAQYDGMDNSLFVDTLINHTGVSFTSDERDAWVSSLANGTSRADVLRSIAENQRFVNAKFNEAFVMMEYFGYLRRDPDTGGFAFWLDKLNQFNGNFEQAEMVRAFIISGEFRDRFPR